MSSDTSNNQANGAVKMSPYHRLKLKAQARQTKLKEAQKEHKVEEMTPVEVQEKSQDVAEPARNGRDLNTSSDSSSERQANIAKRTRVQEQLFTRSCNQAYNKTISSYSNAHSSHTISSDSSPSHHRHHNAHHHTASKNISDHHSSSPLDTDKSEYVDRGVSSTLKGALHLRGPIQNEINEKLYYEDRGRMDPVDWSAVLNGDRKTSNSDKSAEHHRGKGAIPKSAETSITLPPISDEYSNFIHNSCMENNIVFDSRNNIRVNADAESVLIQLQRRLSRFRPITKIPMTEEVRQKFKPHYTNDFHIVELIEAPLKKAKEGESVTLKLDHTIKAEKKPKNRLIDAHAMRAKGKAKKEIEDKENITPVSRNSKKKAYMECDDDMFEFVHPNKQNSSQSYFNSNEDNFSNEVASSTLNTFFSKFSKSGLNKLLDSDDTSAAGSSDFDHLSISRMSTVSKYELCKEKFNADSQTSESPQKKSGRPRLTKLVKQKPVVTEQDYLQEKESFTRENLSRFLESNDLTAATNNIEIVGAKVRSEARKKLLGKKTLLNEVSTQYYSQNNEEVVDSDDNFEKTNKVTKNLETNISSTNSATELTDSDETMEEICDEITNASNIKEIEANPINNGVVCKANANINNAESTCVIEYNSDKNEMVEFSTSVTTENNVTTDESLYMSCNSNEQSEESSTSNEKYLSNKNVTSISSDDDYVITNYANISESPVVIEEIDPNQEQDIDNNNLNVIKTTEYKQTNEPINSLKYDDEIYSDEGGFDVVGIEDFTIYKELLNSIKGAQDAVKAYDIENNINNRQSLSIDKSSGSSSKISSTCSSNGSNLDADDEIISSSTGQSAFFEKDNIFEDVQIDESIWTNENDSFMSIRSNYYNPASNVNNAEKAHDREPQESKRMKRMKNALKAFQEKKKNDAEASKNTHESNLNSEQSRSSKSSESHSTKQPNWILNKIKERNLHLNCKPIDQQLNFDLDEKFKLDHSIP